MADLGMPMDATPDDPVVAYDEYGRAVRQGRLGTRYVAGGASRPAMSMDDFWSQSNALRKPVRQGNMLAETVNMLSSGFTAPGRALAGEPVTYGDVWDTAGTAALGGAAIPGPDGAMMANSFRAYHGSPHSFDKFSMDKIGTGEGAQAYGHGLYFASDENVAKAYRENLSSNQKGAVIGGREYRGDSQQDIAAMAQETGLSPDAAYLVARYADAGADHVERVLGNVRQSKMEYDRVRIPDYEAAVDFMRANPVKPNTPGSMYEVQINADPDTFLDWDKPLSEQPSKVRDWFDSRGITPGFAGNQSGAELLQAEKGVLGAEGTTSAMREASIPGIKYLDHGSRFNSTDAAANTRNYVVFDDKLIDILRKYGLAGLGVGGAAMAQPEQRNFLSGT